MIVVIGLSEDDCLYFFCLQISLPILNFLLLIRVRSCELSSCVGAASHLVVLPKARGRTEYE